MNAVETVRHSRCVQCGTVNRKLVRDIARLRAECDAADALLLKRRLRIELLERTLLERA